MSAPPTTQGVPIESHRQLVDYIASGSKPPAEWRIGTEHEKFVYRLSDLRRLPYDGEGPTIRKLLEGLDEGLEQRCAVPLASRSSCSRKNSTSGRILSSTNVRTPELRWRFSTGGATSVAGGSAAGARAVTCASSCARAASAEVGTG